MDLTTVCFFSFADFSFLQTRPAIGDRAASNTKATRYTKLKVSRNAQNAALPRNKRNTLERNKKRQWLNQSLALTHMAWLVWLYFCCSTMSRFFSVLESDWWIFLWAAFDCRQHKRSTENEIARWSKSEYKFRRIIASYSCKFSSMKSMHYRMTHADCVP